MRAAVLLSAAFLASAAGEPTSSASLGAAAPSDAANVTLASAATPMPTESTVSKGNSSEEPLLQSSRGGWSASGGKMWGSGSGVEGINGGNVGYYDQGMDAARRMCGGAGCALVVNPPGHRSVEKFHIHYIGYSGYGASLKSKMESEVCHAAGKWRGGGLPCHGKAAFFYGSPGVFSKAMTGGSIAGASVIAWPHACSGRGTIVELAYGCSIEHQIRGDYDPNRR
eukprot:CAMPEP_0115067576 /NCGR_PEP_ID=MMETSP0227-20121206/11473_1 /TAXON_ID=89957 /ORGANISM="Polarella glacialis, Strain CCMP 1383" /LENGTH=224 /DNA_ID=CAMNT_0002453671 /DNA_START=35 /DNA_END=710 /DNA_ORIENTATION=-